MENRLNPSNERRKQAVNWALNELAWPQCEQASISSDASFRNYYRLMRDSASFVVMDAPPDVERTQEFVDIAGRLRAIGLHAPEVLAQDRKSTRLNSSHVAISYAVFCLKTKN